MEDLNIKYFEMPRRVELSPFEKLEFVEKIVAVTLVICLLGAILGLFFGVFSIWHRVDGKLIREGSFEHFCQICMYTFLGLTWPLAVPIIGGVTFLKQILM